MIDVLFTGLMLICFDGQADCPVYQKNNTAWILKATNDTVCGWKSDFDTTLDVRFIKSDFYQYTFSDKVNCDKDPDSPGTIICKNFAGRLCLETDKTPLPKNVFPDASLAGLPRLDEVDRRFNALLPQLATYIPDSIDFPKGTITSGPRWPNEARPVLWYRSNAQAGGELPRTLSDRLRVTYENVTTLTLSDCFGTALLTLSNPAQGAQVIIGNRAKVTPHVVNAYDLLPYLLWYYRLGIWNTGDRECPTYAPQMGNSAVVLGCLREHDARCASYGLADRDSVYWPPFIHP